MAATTTTGFSFPASTPVAFVTAQDRSRRRHIDAQAGRALEILGHAIEYLTDEFVHEGTSYFARDAKLEAVRMLMAVNRQVYFECPEVPGLGERVRSLLHLHAA